MLGKPFKVATFVLLGFFSNCASEMSYIKRETPDSTFARAKKGEVVYSATDFRYENDIQRIVYKYWRFIKSSTKSIILSYEEYFDFIKIQPDFKEEKLYTLGDDYSIRLQDMILEIYSLTDKSVVYYIKSGQ